MGSVIDASCRCGFRVEGLAIGSGFAGIEQILLSCATCGEIRTIERRWRDPDGNAYADAFAGERNPEDGCPTCGGRSEVVNEAGGPCPRCGAELQIVGTELLWD